MAERRNSLQPEPAAPRNNKRRRTMMDSVSEVARWLLPSWASEGTSENSPNQHQQTTSGHHQAASSGLINGERNPKRARPNEVTRREPMGRLSPVTPMAPSTTSAQIEADFDDGSDSSTSGCSSLSITTPATVEATDSKNNQRRNRPIQNTKESKTRDVSISVDQTSITAETSITASPSLNFSLFSRPSRALSSTLNASLPLTGSLGATGTRSLSSSLHRPERSLNRSIFYEGKTTYGGAAAHRKLNLFSPSPYQMAAKRSKPASNVNVSEGSSAAKRLIEALERMNTPVQNAKKIPMGRPENALPQSSEARRKEALESIASLRQTSAPPPLSSCRSSVQPARIGNNVKPVLATSSECPIDLDEGDAAPTVDTSNVPVITRAPRTLLDSHDSDRTVGSGAGAGGKMKSAKTIQQHLSRKIPVEEEPPPTAPDLPAAPLPIKDLPSFSFATKTPSVAVTSVTLSQDCHKTSSIRSPLTSLADFSNKPFEKQQMSSLPVVCSTHDASEAFTFAAPVDLDKPTKALHCKEEFGFKDPLYLKKDSLGKSGVFTVAGPTMISGGAFALKVAKAPEVAEPAVSKTLSTGSVMDIIGKVDSRAPELSDQTKLGPSSKTNSIWECPKCSVRSPSGACQACETKKPPPSRSSTTSTSVTTPVTNSWGDQFKKPASSWDCSTCCVNNQSENSTCVACGTAKPGPAIDAAGKSSSASSKPSLGTTVANQWGDLFKKPAGQWSCKTCMVDNKADASKCVACDSPNPAAKTAPATSSAMFGTAATAAPSPASSALPISTVKSPLSAMIKMPPGWDCDTCLVRNDFGKTKCVACESPNPNNKAALDPPGITSSSASSPFPVKSAFKFGVPTSDENKNITAEPVTVVFGMKSTDGHGGNEGSAVPNGFKFGVPSTKPVEDAKSGSAEQSSCSTKPPNTPGFAFGTPVLAVPPVASQTSVTPASATLTSTTTAAASTGTSTAAPVASTSSGFGGFSTAWATGTANKTEAATTGLFAFGSSSTPASSSTSAASSAAAPKSFAFGMSSSAPTATPSATPSAATFNFGATAATSTANPATTTSAAAPFAFGAFSTSAKTLPSGSLFGASSTPSVCGTNTTLTTATSTQSSASTGFSFASATSSAPAATATVCATTTVAATSVPMFTFGSPAATQPSTADTQNVRSAFVFGSTPSAAARLSGFNFNAASPVATTALSAAPSFTFGATSAGPASTALPSVSNGPSVFGSGNLAPATPAFGSSGTNSTPAAPATNTGFQFNSNPVAVASSTSSTPFTFNAASTAPAPAPGGLFAFVGNSGTLANPAATSSATTAVPSAVTPFQFAPASGAAPTPAAATAPNDMFNFGRAAPPAATPVAPFNFVPQTPNPQMPFHFTGAPSNVAPSFSATGENPFDAQSQGRKMRRAVRRRGR